MGMKESCDVFGTTKDIKRYRAVVFEIAPDGSETQAFETAPPKDLCPRALNRLRLKMVAGMSPPTPRTGEVTFIREGLAQSKKDKEAAETQPQTGTA